MASAGASYQSTCMWLDSFLPTTLHVALQHCVVLTHAAVRMLQPFDSSPEHLAWLRDTFPACAVERITRAMREEPHFTILVMQRLLLHRASQVHGEERFGALCNMLSGMYAMYLGRQSCLAGAPQPVFSGKGGGLPTPRMVVQQFFSDTGEWTSFWCC